MCTKAPRGAVAKPQGHCGIFDMSEGYTAILDICWTLYRLLATEVQSFNVRLHCIPFLPPQIYEVGFLPLL